MEKLKIFASIIDDATTNQIQTLSQSDAYKDAIIRIMPDCHAGLGCTIGSVIQYTDRVVPNTVGVDIGCGMLVVELGNIDINLERLDEAINDLIPAGFHKVHDTPAGHFNLQSFNAPLKEKEYLQCSIGTLGGGNHFIELDIDDEDNKYLVIHSGSRYLGTQICEFWQNKAIERLTDDSAIRHELIDRLKAEGRLQDISKELANIKKPNINKELAYLEGQDLEDYIHDMILCQEFADLNRNRIAELILFVMKIHNIQASFTTIHNYVDVPHKIIRKGAVSAQYGETLIIPMNMRDGSLICKGKGNEDWLCSAPHGAGRIMSRKKAFDSLSLAEYKAEMSSIYTTSVCVETIDEAPMVYKPYDVIREDIKDTVDVVTAIRPIYNFKSKT